jgi:hypothetical protein
MPGSSCIKTALRACCPGVTELVAAACASLSPPHPEEPAEASAKVGVSKDAGGLTLRDALLRSVSEGHSIDDSLVATGRRMATVIVNGANRSEQRPRESPFRNY